MKKRTYTPRTIKKSNKDKIIDDKLVSVKVTRELVKTTHTLEERQTIRWLRAAIVEELTGISRMDVQRFIDDKSISIEIASKLAHIIEVLKQL